MENTRTSRALTAGLVALLLAASSAMAGSYKYQPLTFPGATTTTAMGISDDDQVVGILPDTQHGFTWSHGVFTQIDGSRNSSDTELTSVNSKGLAVGWYGSPRHNPRAFTYDIKNGVKNALAGSPLSAFFPTAININGTAIGAMYTPPTHQAFEASASFFQPLPGPMPPEQFVVARAINRSGTVVGWYLDSVGYHGFVYRSAKYTVIDVPGSNYTIITFINDAGVIGGNFSDSAGGHGFVKSGSQYAIFDYPGAASTYVLGMTADGRVVGNWSGSDQMSNGGFVWQNGNYVDITFPGFPNTLLSATNSKGQVVGYYKATNGKQSSFIAECPAAQSPCTQ